MLVHFFGKLVEAKTFICICALNLLTWPSRSLTLTLMRNVCLYEEPPRMPCSTKKYLLNCADQFSVAPIVRCLLNTLPAYECLAPSGGHITVGIWTVMCINFCGHAWALVAIVRPLATTPRTHPLQWLCETLCNGCFGFYSESVENE